MEELTDKQTVGDWLEQLSTADTSTDQDSNKMQVLLRRVGYHNARVVLGIVYLRGKGMLEAPPVDIHSMAGLLVKVARQEDNHG